MLGGDRETPPLEPESGPAAAPAAHLRSVKPLSFHPDPTIKRDLCGSFGKMGWVGYGGGV